MFGHRTLAIILSSWISPAICIVLAMLASGCTSQQTPSASAAQSQIPSDPPIKDLPEVASLSDYMTEGRNDDPFLYPSGSPNEPLVIEPLWFQPCWYPVPVYYVYYPVSPHQHLPPPIHATAVIPSPRVGTRSIVASAASRVPIGPTAFGGLDGAMRGFGGAHIGGFRR
jgi:hypothetical protein